MEYLTLPRIKVPVIMEADVVVVGGGPAGVAAAVRAAQNGADTVVIERLGSLGGMFTNGFMCVCVGESYGGLQKEILDKLEEAGYLFDPLEEFPDLSSNPLFHYYGPNLGPGLRTPSKFSVFDPNMAAYLMNAKMEECGAKLLLDTLFVDTEVQRDAIKAVIVENASGRQAIGGKVFIDATGRGDVVARSGAPYKSAGNEMGFPISPGLMWKMSGVNYGRLFEYQQEDPELDKLINRAKAKGDLLHYRPKKMNDYGGAYTGHPRPEMCPMLNTGDMLLWASAKHEWGLNCAEKAEDLIRSEITIREQIFEELNFLKKCVPGFERAHLSGISHFLGIREGRHPIGEHVMTYADIRNQCKFDDVAIRQSTFDWHDTGQGIRLVTFDIPYRCFLARKINNLLLAGDNISMDHESLLQMRGFGMAFKTGEVAGTAAGFSVKNRIMPKELKWDAPL